MTSGDDLRRLALELVTSQSTMALATAQAGKAWAAPVYYVFYEGSFYFFSAPDSRHIIDALETGEAAATIYPFVSSWKDIRGIQMWGRIRKARPGLKAARAIQAYVEKFLFVKEFFSQGQELGMESFVKRFRVRLYRFEPRLIYYLDNSISFGFREVVHL